MLFALTRSNLLKQLPHGNEIILRLTEIVSVRHSISPIEDIAGGEADKSEHIFGYGSNIIPNIPTFHPFIKVPFGPSYPTDIA